MNIPTRTTFDTDIYDELECSDAVIVLWLRHSVRSDYVKEEADYAKKRGVLIPLNIDGTDPPFGFSRLQATDISGWHGSTQDMRWRNAMNSIEAILGHEIEDPPPEAPPTSEHPELVRAPRRQVSLAFVLATLLVLTMLGLFIRLAVYLISA